MSGLSYADVVRLLDLVDSSGDVDLELTLGETRLKVNRRAGAPAPDAGGAMPQPQPAPAMASIETSGPTPAALSRTAAVPPDAVPVSAPMGGMFYAAPAPGQPPFATVGQVVRTGDQLGIVEVMKLFTPITAPVDGVVRAILVDNQQTVAKDEPLILLDPR
jgi:acetyl-CoA carboxylase biotin carboxyl carrier protein